MNAHRPRPGRSALLRLEPVVGVFATLGSVALIIWMLYNGRVVLMPLAFAIVLAFVLWTAVDWLGRVPGVESTPIWVRHIVVLAIATIALLSLFFQLRLNVEVLMQRLPGYQANVLALLARLDESLGLKDTATGGLSAMAAESVNVQSFARGILSAASNIGGIVALVFLYTAFLMLEYSGIVAKLRLAFPDQEAVGRFLSLGRDVNQRIGGFLAIKTLVNIVLGVVSYGALLWLGVDLAGFWAIVIGILNYVPYLGSAAGVALPSLMVLAQTGSLSLTAGSVVILSLIQFVIGAVFEPRIIGQRMNLSPLVVLLSLASWYALWGLPGAALAIPLTVIIVSLLGAVDFTRPLAVMLSNDGKV